MPHLIMFSYLFQVYGISSFFFVMLSILGFCLETLPKLRPKGIPKVANTTSKCDGSLQDQMLQWEPNKFLNVIDIVCTVFFTLELICRFTFAPNKLKFLRSPMNIIDMLALVPLYVQFVLNEIDIEYCYLSERLIFEVMFILRIIRMFRIFHLVKHYQALKILVCALRASIQEFLMLSIFLIIGMLVFASMIYYAEREDAVNPSKTFTTIPVGFWWAIITMTTVGYGDVYPKTSLGYIVGAGCAVCGVLMVALTIPVISNNFTLFYTHVRSRSEVPKGTRIKSADEVSIESNTMRKRQYSGSSVILETYLNGKVTIHENENSVNSTIVPLCRLSDEFSESDFGLTSDKDKKTSRGAARICAELSERGQGETNL